MNKRFLWICIVLMALVLVIGCDDSPTDGSGGSQQLSEEQGTLLSESMMALVPILTANPSSLSGSSITFDETFTNTEIATITMMLGGEAPQYICADTEIEGSITTSGCTLADIYGDTNSGILSTEVTITYDITLTGTNIPGGTATLEVAATGEYGDFMAEDASDEDFDVSISINGQQINGTFSDLKP